MTEKPCLDLRLFFTKEKLANHVHHYMVHQQVHQHPSGTSSDFTEGMKTILYENSLNFRPPDPQSPPASLPLPCLLLSGRASSPEGNLSTSAHPKEPLSPIIWSPHSLSLSILSISMNILKYLPSKKQESSNAYTHPFLHPHSFFFIFLEAEFFENVAALISTSTPPFHAHTPCSLLVRSPASS